MIPVYPGDLPRRLFERFNKGVEQAREAYDNHPESTHNQPGAQVVFTLDDMPDVKTVRRAMS